MAAALEAAAGAAWACGKVRGQPRSCARCLTAVSSPQPPECHPEELHPAATVARKVTSNPGYRGAEFPDGVDDTPAVSTHHGGLPEPVGLGRTALWGRRGAGSLVRGAARGGESKEREARLLGAGGRAHRDGARDTCRDVAGRRGSQGSGGAAPGAAVRWLLGCEGTVAGQVATGRPGRWLEADQAVKMWVRQWAVGETETTCIASTAYAAGWRPAAGADHVRRGEKLAPRPPSDDQRPGPTATRRARWPRLHSKT
eukprot:COSAG01_NODE_3508_length_5989_cov_5.088115_6_plen_256_part_00